MVIVLLVICMRSQKNNSYDIGHIIILSRVSSEVYSVGEE